MSNLAQIKANALSIRSEIARAKNCFRKEEYERSFEYIANALNMKATSLIFGQAKFEVDLLFRDYFDELKKSPKFLEFLVSLKISAANFFIYKQGSEKLLASRLEIIGARLKDVQEAAKQKAESARFAHKERLLREGESNLEAGLLPKAKVYFKKAVEQFADDPDLLVRVGEKLIAAGLPIDASDIMAPGLERFPAEPRLYKLLIESYTVQVEFEKTEAVYLAALKQFGGHPLTYLNIAKFYYKWRKKDSAYEYAQKALALNPDLPEAREISEKTA